MISPFKSILRQSLIFLTYLGIGSLFLCNHAGGGDIAFIIFMMLAGLIHGIFLIGKTVTRKSGDYAAYSDYDVLTYIVLITLLVVNFERYLQLMWQLTS